MIPDGIIMNQIYYIRGQKVYQTIAAIQKYVLY